MNARLTAVVALAVIAAVVLFWIFLGPVGDGDLGSTRRVEHQVEQVKRGGPVPTTPAPSRVDAQDDQPSDDDSTDDELYELPDEPDVPIDPMSHYPLNRQGFEGGFREMQIEFDACRAEKGVELPDAIEVIVTIERDSPPHEEYGTEPGEIWGLVNKVEIVGDDPERVAPFTDCVTDNLHDLLYTPPKADAVRVKWPMRFTR